MRIGKVKLIILQKKFLLLFQTLTRWKFLLKLLMTKVNTMALFKCHKKSCVFSFLIFFPLIFFYLIFLPLIFFSKRFQSKFNFYIPTNSFIIINPFIKPNLNPFLLINPFIKNNIIYIKNLYMLNNLILFKYFKGNVMLTIKNANMFVYVGFFVICASIFNCTSILKAQEEVELTPLEKLEQTTEKLESAVSKLGQLKVSGYIQTQYQYAETDADGINFKLANRANAYDKSELQSFGHFGVRRGRIKFTYQNGIVQGVFQPDFTEKGISFKDVYLSIQDPWFGTMSIKSGIFDRPFGYEISYSSSSRESPERSRIFQTLFPDERDLGTMLTLQAPKTSPWNFITLSGGLFAGSGIKAQYKNQLDFIGHLSAKKNFDNLAMSISGGISAYLGSTISTNDSLYKMQNNDFVIDNINNKGKRNERTYIGADIQFSIMTETLGLTQLFAEYIIGINPGEKSGAYDFKLTAVPTNPVYMRKIQGGYILFTQDLFTTPFTIVAKYDWYDPNTDISGNDINNKGEIQMNNIGCGLIWRINNNLRLTAYYDIVSNETTDKLADVKDDNGAIKTYGYEQDRKDNVFTLRLQYKF